MSTHMPALAETGFTAKFVKDTGPHLGTGDFNRFSHDQVIEVINAQALKTHQALVPMDEQGVEHPLPIVHERVRALVEVLDDFKAHVANPANYPEGAKSLIVGTFAAADESTVGTNMLTRVRERVGSFPEPPLIVSDLDGTLTELTDMHDHLMTKIPASFIAEPILAQRSRRAFAEVFVSTWQPILRDAPRIFEAASEGVKLRPGVHRYFEETMVAGIETKILSANFEPFVHGVMKQIPEADGIDIVAVTPDDLRATEKAPVLEHFAQSNPNRAVIYLGDGTSDINAITDIVACYFALEGSQFSKELTARGVPHLTYRDFHDVTEALRQIYPKMESASLE